MAVLVNGPPETHTSWDSTQPSQGIRELNPEHFVFALLPTGAQTEPEPYWC
jgi:hypothetical protein